jgi:hypothetical protein
MGESETNSQRSRSSSRLNCHFFVYRFVLFYGSLTARNVFLAAASSKFSASECRYSIFISFGKIISAANYLFTRAARFDRRGCGSLYCISFARRERAGNAGKSGNPNIINRRIFAGLGSVVGSPSLVAANL